MRWLVVGASGLALVVVVMVVAAVLVARGGDGPEDRFERVAKTFHDAAAPLEQTIADRLPVAQGFGDPAFVAATQGARSLADLYAAYAKEVRALAVPEAAKASVTDLGDVLDAGQKLMVNAAGFFSGSAMRATLEQYWQPLRDLTAKREAALRQALDG